MEDNPGRLLPGLLIKIRIGNPVVIYFRIKDPKELDIIEDQIPS